MCFICNRYASALTEIEYPKGGGGGVVTPPLIVLRVHPITHFSHPLFNMVLMRTSNFNFIKKRYAIVKASFDLLDLLLVEQANSKSGD